MRCIWLVGLAVVGGACGGDDDGGAADAGRAPEAGGETIDAATPADAGRDGGSAGDDAGSPDAGPTDAGRSDAGPNDAGSTDAGGAACVPGAVSFPMGGSLAPGTLCDDVYLCVADSAEAARVMAASSRFACSSTPEFGCSAISCAYRDPGGPSVLDAAEIAEICAVTLITPTPSLVCRVYL